MNLAKNIQINPDGIPIIRRKRISSQLSRPIFSSFFKVLLIYYILIVKQVKLQYRNTELQLFYIN